jgi:hypothetical protein
MRDSTDRLLSHFHHERWNSHVSIAAPLVVAAVAVTGFLWLSIHFGDGAVAAGQLRTEHAAAIQRLFFDR